MRLRICIVCVSKVNDDDDVKSLSELNKKVFSFFLKSLVSVISLMSTGRLFHALGAATENARSDETSLERGTTRSCLPAERREARPGMLATGVTNSVRYDGERPLTAWCTKRLEFELNSFCNW